LRTSNYAGKFFPELAVAARTIPAPLVIWRISAQNRCLTKRQAQASLATCTGKHQERAITCKPQSAMDPPECDTSSGTSSGTFIHLPAGHCLVFLSLPYRANALRSLPGPYSAA